MSEVMAKFIHKFVRCNLNTRGKGTRRTLGRIAYKDNDSDGYDVWGFRCSDCLCEWDATDFSGGNFETATCSDCYSDNVRITKIRLERTV